MIALAFVFWTKRVRASFSVPRKLALPFGTCTHLRTQTSARASSFRARRPSTRKTWTKWGALKADVVHVNPLWLGEFPLSLLGVLRPSAAILCADAQGFLRVPEPDGRLAHRDLPQKRDVFSLLDLFRVDAKEALILTGEDDPRRAARAVQALGPKLVLVTHRDGVCLFDGSSLHEASFSGFTLEGRTGRGDTCTASFLAARGRGMNLAEAASFAAEVTSRKMQYRGPFRG